MSDIYHSTTASTHDPGDVRVGYNPAGIEPIGIFLGAYVQVYLSPEAAAQLVEQVTAALAEAEVSA